MRVQPLYNNKSVSFTSGLTKELLRKEAQIKPCQIENKFRNLPTMDWGPYSFWNIDFKNNKAVALASSLCSQIFPKFRKIADYRNGWSMQNLVSPQDIYVFNENDSEKYKDLFMFVNFENDFYEKSKRIFEKGTVFINNKYNSLECVNDWTESCYHGKIDPSGHFLSPFVHEWIHSIETKLLDNIAFRCSRYSGIIQKISSLILDAKESEIVADVIGNYAAKQEPGQYMEVMAEAWSKFICESLSEDCINFVKNPVELMKQTPKEFQNILKKVTDIRTINEKY